MGIISTIKGWINMLFKSKVKEEFEIEPIVSKEMEDFLKTCADIYRGDPYWLDDEEHVKTINFAKTVCSEVARLATLAVGVNISGSTRADWLQDKINNEYYNIRKWMEYACAFGTVVLKPNMSSIDVYTPSDFIITDSKDGDISGIVFVNQVEKDKKYYTRLEYHRFVNEMYVITNKCYVGDTKNDMHTEIDIELTPWNGLMQEIGIIDLEKPLYAVLKTPHANNIDINSPLSLPIFTDAIEEFKDLDIAYSRNAKEIFDSKRTVLLDSDRLLSSGTKLSVTSGFFAEKRKELGLPDYVKNVYGDGVNECYHEINPTLNTDTRVAGINALLSQIGFKCGFSNGYFVFNESTGIQTATGVEAEQQRTIQFIKDVRDKLECCMSDLIYAINAFADLYELAPVGMYEVVFDFGDITYNREEDRARWYSYANSGKIPFWYYLVKFEGLTEEEAKAMVSEAQPKETTFFSEE